MSTAEGRTRLTWIIDGHAHSAGEFYRGEDVVAILDRLGVDTVILCPGPINEPRKWPVPDITYILKKRGFGLAGSRLLRLASRRVAKHFSVVESNAYVAGMARRFSGRIVQAYWADPTVSGFLDELKARHAEWNFRAVKLHQCFQKFRVDSPAMRDLADFAGGRDLPIFIHLYSKREARALAGLATEFRRTTFVVAHMLGLDVFASPGREAPSNLYFDISPPNLTPIGRLMRALKALGPNRLLLGSDTPYGKNNLAAAIARVRGLDLPEDDKILILGENARRIYRL